VATTLVTPAAAPVIVYPLLQVISAVSPTISPYVKSDVERASVAGFEGQTLSAQLKSGKVHVFEPAQVAMTAG